MNQPDEQPATPPQGGVSGDPSGRPGSAPDEGPTRLERQPAPGDTSGDQQRLLAGRYRLDQVLGRGSMGAVWRAHDVILRRAVAVKEVLLPPTQSAEENAVSRERALREARAIAALSHPNVVTLFDVVEDDGRPWVVMELVPARSLAEIIKEDGPLPPVEAARIGLAVLAALDSAHEVGITHRDVKPGNILVSSDGRVKLADFGISRKVDESQLTQTGLMVGSPSYIAPEVARGREAGRAADVWGLGATLHCAVEGEPPFDLGDAVATLTAVVGDPPRPAPHAGPLAGILLRCLDKDPRTRIRSDELRQALRSVANRVTSGPRPLLPPVSAAPPSRPLTAPGTTPQPTRPPQHTGMHPAYRPPVSRGGPPSYPPVPPAGPRGTGPQRPGGPGSWAPAAAPSAAAKEAGQGWVIGLSIALVVVIVAGALYLLLSDSGNGGNGGAGATTTTQAPTTTTEPTTTQPTGVKPESSQATIDGTTAKGAVKVAGEYRPFSFALPEGWAIAKNDDGRTEFVEDEDASDADLVKVTVVAGKLNHGTVDEQIEKERDEIGSPAKLKDFVELEYDVTNDGAVLWQYTNTSSEGSERRGFFYAFQDAQGILWKIILIGPVDQGAKLQPIINGILSTIQTS